MYELKKKKEVHISTVFINKYVGAINLWSLINFQ